MRHAFHLDYQPDDQPRDQPHDQLGLDADRFDRDDDLEPAVAPGKRTLTSYLRRRPGAVVQRMITRGGAAARTAPAPSGPGRPLPAHIADAMSRAFATDFSAVRIHRGDHVAGAGARAYTVGDEVHLAGDADLDSAAGRELLAHELAHVVQQRQGRVAATTEVGGVPVNDDPALEDEADRAGARAARGEAVGDEVDRRVGARGAAVAARRGATVAGTGPVQRAVVRAPAQPGSPGRPIRDAETLRAIAERVVAHRDWLAATTARDPAHTADVALRGQLLRAQLDRYLSASEPELVLVVEADASLDDIADALVARLVGAQPGRGEIKDGPGPGGAAVGAARAHRERWATLRAALDGVDDPVRAELEAELERLAGAVAADLPRLFASGMDPDTMAAAIDSRLGTLPARVARAAARTRAAVELGVPPPGPGGVGAAGGGRGDGEGPA